MLIQLLVRQRTLEASLEQVSHPPERLKGQNSNTETYSITTLKHLNPVYPYLSLIAIKLKAHMLRLTMAIQ